MEDNAQDASLCQLERPYKCTHEDCPKMFTTAYHLRRHVGTVHVDKKSQKVYLCPEPGCGHCYTLSSNLKRHMKTHEDPMPYKCDVSDCNCSFKKRSKLMSHMGWAHKLKPFRCDTDDCCAEFNLPSELKRHKKTHKEYLCTIEGCDEVCKSWSLLRKHIAVYHKKKYVCSKCNLSFRTPKELEVHSSVHEDMRHVFKCDREGCNRTYTTLYNLKQHVESFHELSKPFQCSMTDCKARFAHKQSLLKHLQKLHSSEKNADKPKVRARRRKTAVSPSLPSLVSGHIVCTDKEQPSMDTGECNNDNMILNPAELTAYNS